MPYIDKEKFRMHIIRYQNNPLKVILTDKEKEKFIRMLDEVPTADVVEVKHGKWKKMWHSNLKQELPCCSVCGHFSAMRWKYCPECGADMRKETEDDND